MTQYLLSVHGVDGEAGEPMTDEQMRQTYLKVMALQAEMKSAGAWVFGGRLHEPGTATVVRMSGGEMLTKTQTFTGKELVLNFSTSAAGGIRVEIQDASGKAIPGFALADAVETIGNEIERVVRWKTGPDVSTLAGKPIRLRFVMRDARLFSLRFRP